MISSLPLESSLNIVGDHHIQTETPIVWCRHWHPKERQLVFHGSSVSVFPNVHGVLGVCGAIKCDNVSVGISAIRCLVLGTEVILHFASSHCGWTDSARTMPLRRLHSEAVHICSSRSREQLGQQSMRQTLDSSAHSPSNGGPLFR